MEILSLPRIENTMLWSATRSAAAAAAGDSKKSLDHISKLAWLLEFLNFYMLLSEGCSYQCNGGIVHAIAAIPVFDALDRFCEEPSLITNSHQQL